MQKFFLQPTSPCFTSKSLSPFVYVIIVLQKVQIPMHLSIYEEDNNAHTPK